MKASLPLKVCPEEIKYYIGNTWNLTDKNLNATVGSFLSSHVPREQKEINQYDATHTYSACINDITYFLQ